MGSIQLSQPGGAGTLTADGDIGVGTRCYLSPIGVSLAASNPWALTAIPASSSATIKIHPRLGWYFDPDAGPGKYTVRLTDSLSNTYTNTFTASSLGPSGSGRTFNVQHFGAVPSASASYATRNTTAFYGAAAAANASGGGRVYVPAGTYALELQNSSNTKAPLHLIGFSNVEFVGDGRYASILVDPQAMSNTPDIASITRGNAFITFRSCSKCGVRNLGFRGANVWSQARLTTGTAVLNRKGVYFESSGGVGCTDCYVLDCYFENIEGETVFADGNANGLKVFDSHFYRCQVHAINWAGGNGLSAYRNRIEDMGQSAFQCGGTNVGIGHNIVTTSIDSGTGLPWVTAGDLMVIANMQGALIHDNIFYNARLTASTVNGVALGYNDDRDVADVAFVRNHMENIFIAIGAGNHNGVLGISAAVGALKNIYVGDNVFLNCGGSATGGAYRAAIKVSGGLAVGGTIGPNFVSNGSSGSLDVGVHFDSALNASNTLRLETQRIAAGAVLLAPYVMEVAAADDARVLVGSKTWDPGSVADAAMTSTTVTIGGVRTGDGGVVSFTGATLVAGILWSATATATDVMTVTLFNKTGGALDLGSGTLTVHVVRT